MVPSFAEGELILNWRFSAAGQNKNLEKDDSGHGHMAQLMNENFRRPPYHRMTDGVHGKESGSVRLKTGSQVKSLNPFELPDNWTLSFWVRARTQQESIPENVKLGDFVSIKTRFLGPSSPWYFRIDPDGKGQDMGWHKGGNDKSWQRIQVPAFWSNTHVGSYLGYGWYKTSFYMPESLADMKHELHFEGVDEQAWVYINGEKVGEQSVEYTGKGIGEIWDEPFSVSFGPDQVNAGEENLLVVRCHGSQGNAGIFRPVYFIPPRDMKHKMDLDIFEMKIPEPDKWNHVALTSGPNEALLWINGERVSTLKKSLWPHDSRRVSMNFMLPGSGSYFADLDDIRIYDSVLSESEVNQLSHVSYHPEARWLDVYCEEMQGLIHSGEFSKERAEYLVGLGAPNIDALVETLITGDGSQKLDAALALRMIGGIEVVQPLIKLLDIECPEVASAVNKGIAGILRDEKIISQLTREQLAHALEYGGWNIRRFAVRELRQRGEEHPKGLIEFEDVTEDKGLDKLLAGWHLGHGGAWGDVTGNNRPDLYIGSFADRRIYGDPNAPIPNMLFLNKEDGFTLSPDETVRLDMRGKPSGERYRVSMALFADLDGSGKLDLLVGNHMRRNHIFENHRSGEFRDVRLSDGDCEWPEDFDMRDATAVDLDRDGLLDLILVDGRYDYRGTERRLRAMRNLGDFRFEDISFDIGFPDEDTPGLGLATGDVNNNGRPDFFVAQSNRMLISRDDGSYREYRPGFFSKPAFSPEGAGTVGAALADMTGNGLLDLVFTVHGIPPQVFIYVNRGIDEDGMPYFENVTREAGLDLDFPVGGVPLPDLKSDARHRLLGADLALVDLDNSGKRDILLAMTHLDERGRLQPLVLRNKEVIDGVPRFSAPPLNKLAFYCTTPVADYDRDGRMDIFMATWYRELDSYLFRNSTDGGNYLTVRVEGESENLNSMGIGAVIRLYKVGHAGEEEYLLGRGDIALAQGYSSGDEALAHFGLGDVQYCDVVVTWQEHEAIRENVKVNRLKVISVGD